MNEEKDTLESQIIDQVIESGSVSPQDRQTTRLIQQLHTYSQEYAQTNERSLDRIWNHLAQSQDQPFSPLTRKKSSEEKIIMLKERKAMQDTPISGVMNSSPSLLPLKKRRSLIRIVGLSLIAAVILITVVSFALFSGFLRSATPTAIHKGSNTNNITGSPSHPQIAISRGTPVCSFSAGSEVMLNNMPWKPVIAWSSQGEIAVTNYASAMASSAQNCASVPLSQTAIQKPYGAFWSPDGKKLLVGDASDNTAYVLNSQGNIITHLSNVVLTGGAWSSDSTKITVAAQGISQQLNLIQSIDLSHGDKRTTLATFPYNSIVGPMSSDGKIALVYQGNIKQASKSLAPSIWNVTSGKKISDLLSNLGESGLNAAFSPDGSQLAVSIPGAIQIYTPNGHLQASIADTSSANIIHTLAWSPNGKYLAESANAIKIYNINTKKLVTTFGTVDSQHQIVNLAWAPDNTGIASTTIVSASDVPDSNTVNIWKLS